jgi:CheY-like chemotaxis protein
MAGTGGRVLVVDDNADAAETLARLLALVGWEARTAADGVQALHTVEAFAPDVALLDIGLPGMDGYELARRLRGHANARSTLIVALTGYGRDPDRARALAAGFDEHLVKPVAAERLFELLEQRARLNASLGPAD